MEIVNIKTEDIKPYINNPRFNDEAVKYVANSIKEFGFKVPIILDKNNIIVAGHTRYKASLELGLEEVPCIIADDLTEEQIKAFRLADNKAGETSTWNIELLDEELASILNLDMKDFGFLLQEEMENPYSIKVNIPQYEIEGEPMLLKDCIDTTKTDELVSKIKASAVNDEQKDFLIRAATRHYVFNYRNIAEYYAGTTAEMQELMEQSALVIIDLENAIANGYAEMVNKLKEMYDE